MARGRLSGRHQGGFLRTSPWLRSAGNQRRPLVAGIAAVVAVALGVWIVVGLIGAGSQPVLPSAHVVLVSVQEHSNSHVTGEGRLVWYQQGKLLVVAMTIRGLSPGTHATAELAPTGRCSGSLPAGSRQIGTAKATSSGGAQFGNELTGVSDLRFSQWALWIYQGGRRSSPTACGVLKLVQPGQL